MLGPYHLTPYELPELLAAVLAVALCGHALVHRKAPGAISLAFVLFFLAVGTLGSALEDAAVLPATRRFWFDVQAATPLIIATAYLTFSVEYGGFERWLSPPVIALLTVPPLIAFALLATNSWLGLPWISVSLGRTVTSTPGTGFLILEVYLFAICFLSLAIWIMLLVRWRRHRLITAALVVMSFCIVAAFILDADMFPGTPIELSVLLADLFCILCFLAVFRWQLFDVLPVARALTLERIRDGVLVFDRRNELLDANPAGHEFLLVLSPPPDGALASADGSRAAQGLLAEHHLGERAEIVVQGADGPRYFGLDVSLLSNSRGFFLGHLVITRETTSLRRAQAALFEDQAALAMMQERERMGRELHDTIVQTTASLRTLAETGNVLLERGETARAMECFARLADAAQETHVELREFLYGVSLTSVAERDLVGALRSCVAHFQWTWGVQTELLTPAQCDAVRVSELVRFQVLRIVEEALANVRKHAQARHASLSMTRESDCLVVVVEDDGRGFDMNEFEFSRAGHGLDFMAERAQSVGGTVQVTSRPGEGTRVVARVPASEVRHASATG